MASTSNTQTKTTGRSLPDGWQWVKLNDVCKQDRQVVESNSAMASRLLYLSLEHIESQSGRILREPSEPIQDEGKSLTFHFDNRHVLYGKLRPYLNKVALPDYEGRCTTELIPILPIGMDRDFLAWVLRRKETVDAAMQEKTGSRMPRANMDNLFALKIPLPPLNEQRRIAKRLNEQMAAVESARKAAEEQLEAARQLRSAYLREVFEGDEAKRWQAKFIGDFAETGSGTTPSRTRSDYYADGTIPWVKTGELKDGIIHDAEEHVTDLAIKETSLKLLPAKTLLIAMYGQGQTRGRTTIIGKPMTINQACFAILPNDSFDTEFIQLWFRYSYDRLRKETEGRGGNQPNLNGQVLNKQRVPLPPLEEQKKIVRALNAKLDNAENVRTMIESQLAEINRLPASLLREAFAGNV